MRTMECASRYLVTGACGLAFAACGPMPEDNLRPEVGEREAHPLRIEDGGDGPTLGEGGNAVHTLDETVIATEDGLRTYVFKFSAVEGGPLVTEIDVPIGYPEPLIGSDTCALETFLRVSSEEKMVPSGLIEFCGLPFGLTADDVGPGPYVVGDLRPESLELSFETLEIRAAPLCSRASFDDRVDELWDLARYQPLTETCTSACVLRVNWGTTYCYFDNPTSGQLVRNCSQSEWWNLQLQGQSGERCLDWDVECHAVLDPDCSHDEIVLSHYGPWTDWLRITDDATVTRTEISNCGREPVTGYWQSKSQSTWSPQKPFSSPADTRKVVRLSAGQSNGSWRGWDFRVRARGTALHIAHAVVYLQGRPYPKCEIKL